MEQGSGRICPSCKKFNGPDATYCVHCGTPFEALNPGVATTVGMPFAKVDQLLQHPEPPHTAPEMGIAFFFAYEKTPFELCIDDEFLLGRKTDETTEKIVDLIAYDAFGQGVSRRHAKIRHTETGYEIIDLESTNGTWVDEQRLVPNRPYPLPSGALLRLGRMSMYVTYRETPK